MHNSDLSSDLCPPDVRWNGAPKRFVCRAGALAGSPGRGNAGQRVAKGAWRRSRCGIDAVRPLRPSGETQVKIRNVALHTLAWTGMAALVAWSAPASAQDKQVAVYTSNEATLHNLIFSEIGRAHV